MNIINRRIQFLKLSTQSVHLNEQEENRGNDNDENNFYSLGVDDHNDLEEDNE